MCVFLGGKNVKLGECVGVVWIEADGVGFMAKRFWIGKNFSFLLLISFIVIFFKSGNKSALVCETHHLIFRLEMCGQEALVL